ncbi:hypothetical protein JCM21142_114631 [Saccharicrinis fermentans DSM 9555 = JCM 21142]|uniref:Uncharacterized protein n=1 Tax=Saccharicrinis fermentans DSM 9555 = JCM 21142 TaxID=869213 RepID=W7YEH0_9BACT|nr:hypothetical protein JCM21142_114631 [Saccharicrinis fermentans DSM 9555 = JCM 21142]
MKQFNATPKSQVHCLVTQADTQPKPVKELALPTHELTEKIKHETLSRNIRKPDDVANLNFCTFSQIHNGLTGWSFEISASTYCHPFVCHTKKRDRA